MGRMVFVLLAFAGIALGDGKAVGVAGRGLDTTTDGGQKWALVIGINEYSNVPELDFARQDAVALKNALIKAGFPAKQIILMTDTSTGPMYPTRSNIRSRITQVADFVEKDDALFVFFSGHGVAINGQGYLVPIDGNSLDRHSMVPLSWVKETIETCPAKHRLLILDACHSGAKTGDLSASPAKTMLSAFSGAAFATLSSCDTDQLSYEDKTTGHGVFTTAIIEGLQGAADKTAQGNNDNILNATELWAYATLKTKQWSAKSGKTQTPTMKGEFKGLIEIARFQSVEDLQAQKDKLQKDLAAMEELNQNSAAEQLRKEIANLETQLSTIEGGTGDVTGSDEVQIAYAKYNAAKKQVDELDALLVEKLKIYQPTSKAIAKIEDRIATAVVELQATLQAKYHADTIMYERYQKQINAKQAQYDELIKELLPSAPQARKLADEIEKLIQKQSSYEDIKKIATLKAKVLNCNTFEEAKKINAELNVLGELPINQNVTSKLRVLLADRFKPVLVKSNIRKCATIKIDYENYISYAKDSITLDLSKAFRYAETYSVARIKKDHKTVPPHVKIMNMKKSAMMPFRDSGNFYEDVTDGKLTYQIVARNSLGASTTEIITVSLDKELAKIPKPDNPGKLKIHIKKSDNPYLIDISWRSEDRTTKPLVKIERKNPDGKIVVIESNVHGPERSHLTFYYHVNDKISKPGKYAYRVIAYNKAGASVQSDWRQINVSNIKEKKFKAIGIVDITEE